MVRCVVMMCVCRVMYLYYVVSVFMCCNVCVCSMFCLFYCDISLCHIHIYWYFIVLLWCVSLCVVLWCVMYHVVMMWCCDVVLLLVAMCFCFHVCDVVLRYYVFEFHHHIHGIASFLFDVVYCIV